MYVTAGAGTELFREHGAKPSGKEDGDRYHSSPPRPELAIWYDPVVLRAGG